MRRKDRERDANFALEVARDCEFATLATVNADGTPYCIPISPVLYNGYIYFHCAHEGHKIDNIKRNSAVCLSCTRYTAVIPDELTADFECAVIKGKCDIISDEAEKVEALRALCIKYSPAYEGDLDAVIMKLIKFTCVCRITIDEITGKSKIGVK